MLGKNQIVQVEIVDVTKEGHGVGRADGCAVFIPRTAVGDQVRAKVIKVLSSYAVARVEEYLSVSPARRQPQCPVYQRCGGCIFCHMEYEEELRIKNKWVSDDLQRIGKLSVELPPVLTNGVTEGYRNKAQYPVRRTPDGKLAVGFFARHSHQVISCIDCQLQPAEFSRILKVILEFLDAYRIPAYDEVTHRGLVRHIYLRRGEATGEIMVCLVLNGTQVPHSQELVRRLLDEDLGITSIILNENRQKTNVILGKRCITLYGSDIINDILCGIKVRLSPLSFYQVNHAMAQKLYETAREFAGLTGGETLLDLYCGAGTIGLSMAGELKELIGVEIVPQAVENAWENARANGITNARFLCADAQAAAQQLALEGVHPDVVVMDPPRKGSAVQVLDCVDKMAPQRLVYISCNSATLARDCAYLKKLGWQVTRAQAVDLFPRTGHVETVCLLERKLL